MSNVQLFPLVPKAAGFLKDGSLYQGDYCTNGQWVRFYQGKPKKMGGQRAIARMGVDKKYNIPQNCTHLTSVWVGGSIIYIAVNSEGIWSNSCQATAPDTFISAWNRLISFVAPIRQEKILWQSEVVVVPLLTENGEPSGPSQTHLVLLGCSNLQNINSVEQGLLYDIPLTENATTLIPKNITNIFNQITDPYLKQFIENINGGLVYANPFLFLYGTKGSVLWSQAENPLRFIPYGDDKSTSGAMSVSTDKVVYAAEVRGGNNPPTVLFWTMNSVVRISNQTDSGDIKVKPEFQKDVITQACSILSSRSVVEYDGMFFWLGIDRMFFYNGVVREMVNNINFDWFFKKLDNQRRQLVFGIKNSEKGEIWWYFPVVGVDGGCSAALIYNIRENIWYNTNIQRDCGFFNGESGKMITYGKKLAPDSITRDTNSYIWVHEDGIQQVSDNKSAVGIDSTYTTPIISFTAFSPAGEGGGQNNNIWIDRIEPDFNLAPRAEMIMRINAKDYADQKSTVISDNIKIIGGGGKVDLRAQGRNVSFTFSSQANFQHGFPLIGIKVGDARG